MVSPRKYYEMYLITIILSVLCTSIECANYQRYGETTYRYPTSTIPLNSIYKTGSYGNDIANFPESTRYPNYSPGYGYTTSRYPYSGYSTNNYNGLYSGGSTNVNYNNGLYGSGSNNYNQRYNLGRYGEGFGGGYGRTASGGYSNYDDVQGCKNMSPQTEIWVDSLMGIWYGVELIQHLGPDSRLDYVRTCIVIHIAEPKERPSTDNQFYHVQHINAKFRQEYRHLRLLWDEAGKTIEYALYFRNDSAGYWHVYDGQNGSLTSLPNYQQFSGTVQVLKAVNDHLLLNFCQDGTLTGRPGQLYSVLFSRNPGDMNQWEIDSIHSLLQTKKLSVASRRMVCGNSSAERLTYSILFSFLTCLLAYVIGTS